MKEKCVDWTKSLPACTIRHPGCVTQTVMVVQQSVLTLCVTGSLRVSEQAGEMECTSILQIYTDLPNSLNMEL